MSEVVSVRVDSTLKAKLKSNARELGLTEGGLVRLLIERHFGNSTEEAAVNQIVWAIHAQMRGAMDRVGRKMREVIRVELTEPFDELAVTGEPGEEEAAPKRSKSRRGRRGGGRRT